MPSHPARGHWPRQVTRPFGAVRVTIWLHLGHLPRTLSGGVTFAPLPRSTDHGALWYLSFRRERGCSVGEQPSALVRLARLSRATKEAEVATKVTRDLRDAEIDAMEAAGHSVREIARICDLSPATVVGVLGRQAAKRG